MKELKILAVVVGFSLLTYFLVEPFAHSKMHKHVEGHDFIYNGKADIEDASKDKKAVKKQFWADVKKISTLKGNALNGESLFVNCTACHSGSNLNMGGVIPPKLDNAGALYDKNYLIALIKNPAMASNVDHKYADTSMHPMGSIKYSVSQPQDIADVVAYILEKKAGKITPKEAFEQACSRCHSMKYAKATQLGDTPKFKEEKDTLAYQIKVLEEQDRIKEYMGKLPPDLSIIIRARTAHYLETFVENPQSQLHGTSMPRVGLTKAGYEKVTEYLEEVGDPSKKKREAIGPWVIGFFIIFTILAFLSKKYQWRDLH